MGMPAIPRLQGTFVEPIDELIPRFALPPHQVSATVEPRQPTKHLVLAVAGQALERNINDLLSDPSLR